MTRTIWADTTGLTDEQIAFGASAAIRIARQNGASGRIIIRDRMTGAVVA